MINISDPRTASNTSPRMAIWDLAFRPFFLLAALFSCISLSLWVGLLLGHISLHVYATPFWWHLHEMLFAFAATVIVGFLLTAVQTWSGVRSLHGKKLAILVFIWLLARVALLLPLYFPTWLIVTLDLSFLPLAAFALAIPIIKTKLWRNLMFVPILLIMSITNAVFHYAAFNADLLLTTQAANFMVLLITLVMCIMGGRVFPMFTANGTQTPRVAANPTLEKLANISIVLSVLCSMAWLSLPAGWLASLFIVTAVIHGVRVFRWQFSVTLKTPLVWSLHCSYWCIALGLFMLGLSHLALVTHSQAIHTLTVGAMGTMILSMISRVSLGHTGRIIKVGRIMTIAFICLICAFLVRVFGHYLVANYSWVLMASAALWLAAFVCFLGIYFPILIKPRIH